MDKPHRYCVIMCGGVGSRFWPFSRAVRPKQFIDFLGTGRSLLQMTFDRIKKVVSPDNIYIVTNIDYADIIREQLPEISSAQVLCEPARRNTAPCIAWATTTIAARDPEASIIVTPSDHVITDDLTFIECIDRGFTFAEKNNALLTLGITPTRPDTGYGYIQCGTEVHQNIMQVESFREKPDEPTARQFLAEGNYLWNAGIFIWRATSILDALRKYAPECILPLDENCDSLSSPNATETIARIFPTLPSISIDYAVMEHATNVYVERATFGWSDLGTWGALHEHMTTDDTQNVSTADVLLSYESCGNIIAVKNTEKLVVVSGLDNYIIADTNDVLMICPRSDEQSIRKFVEDASIVSNGKLS